MHAGTYVITATRFMPGDSTGQIVLVKARSDKAKSSLVTYCNLTAMQEWIGGYVSLRNNIIFDEEGELRSLPYNAEATRLAGFTLLGPVVFLAQTKLRAL